MKKILKVIVGSIMCAILFIIVLTGCAAVFAPAAVGWSILSSSSTQEPVEGTSHFDTRVLETWCGEPQGTIRMVGGWYYEPGTIEDEQGNLWNWDGELKEDGFYLLWIDGCGTETIKDDEIIKAWKEIP